MWSEAVKVAAQPSGQVALSSGGHRAGRHLVAAAHIALMLSEMVSNMNLLHTADANNKLFFIFLKSGL